MRHYTLSTPARLAGTPVSSGTSATKCISPRSTRSLQRLGGRVLSREWPALALRRLDVSVRDEAVGGAAVAHFAATAAVAGVERGRGGRDWLGEGRWAVGGQRRRLAHLVFRLLVGAGAEREVLDVVRHSHRRRGRQRLFFARRILGCLRHPRALLELLGLRRVEEGDLQRDTVRGLWRDLTFYDNSSHG